MKIAFVGDVMLGRLVNEALKHEAPNYPWGDTLDIMKIADIRICNLECVITDVGQPWSITHKVFHFRTDEKNIAVLNVPPINLASIANNHVLDYEYEGLNRMVKVLTSARIDFAGAGSSFLDVSTVAEYFTNSTKIGMIAFTDNEPDWAATDKKPGVFYVPVDPEDKRAKSLFELVKETKDDVDILIVSAHWGPNWGYNPPEEHITFAHTLIEAGADIIFGHSGHVFRGIELYKKKIILYCAGDFIDDYAVDEIERNDQSFIYIVETKNHRVVKLMLYPTVIRNFQAQLAKGLEKKLIVNNMQNLCQELSTKTQWLEKQGYLEIKL